MQVRNVGLLVDGRIVATDISFPYDLTAVARRQTVGANTIEVQIIAADTGGNSTVSDSLVFELVPDTFAPTVVGTTPASEDSVFYTPSIDVRFDEPLDGSLLLLSGVSVTNLGEDGVLGGGDDASVPLDTLALRSLGRRLAIIPDEVLETGRHLVTIDAAIISDRAGNVLGSDISFEFNVRPASDIRADSGTATVERAPSANPNQAIGLRVPGLTSSTTVTFNVANASGTVSQLDVTPLAFDAADNIAYYTVPLEAVTGDITVNTTTPDTFLLQIVPTISFADLTSLSISSASFRLSGSGFIEDSDTLYTFGSESLLDTSGVVNVYNSNRTSDLSLPYSSGIFGAVTVTTAGGTSAAFSVGLTEVDSVALSGTPANANEASANSGQAIDIVGSGLSTSTDVVGRYVDDSGNVQVTHLNPSSATADGTQATIQLPTWFNGAFGLQVVGAVAQPLLQIVPTIQSIDVYTTNGVRVDGRGFVENGSSYDYGGAVKTDTDGSVNVYSNGGRSDMGGLPVFGAGQLVVTTAGGTSAAVAYNFINPGLSTLYAVEQSSSGDLFVIAGSRVQRINSAGELQQTYASISLSYGGLYELTSPLELRDTPSSTLVTLPAGTLLVFKNNDVIDALDPSTDTVLASFDPGPNFGTIGGVFNPVTGTLFFLDWSPDEVIEIDPATGGELSRFAAPLAGGNGGITVDPVSGNLWLAFDGSSQLAEVQVDGTLLQTIDMASQGIATEMSGLDYLGGGQFLASSLRGVIYQLTTIPPQPQAPVLSGLVATAHDGIPANSGVASANVGESIELLGQHLTLGTPVIFETRDNLGVVGTESVVPTAVSADGTRAQVVVPNLASTGDVTLGGAGSGSVRLQIVPTIFGMSGRQGINATFDLVGSGFMEGASTITTGGTVFNDIYTNILTDDVTEGRNSRYRLSLPLAVEGPITVTTEGGFFTFGGPAFGEPSFVDLVSITPSAVVGTAADLNQAAVHAGELLTLRGHGFTNGTLVQFDSVDENGVAGILTRTGTATGSGTVLTVVVPLQAVTGNVRVVGDSATQIPLQIVPQVRSVGGDISPGNQIILEGTGLVEGDLTVTVDGQAVTVLDVVSIEDRDITNAGYFAQQVVRLTVPSGVSDGVINVTTSGGSFSLRSGVVVDVLDNVNVSGDLGDTLASALEVNLPADSMVTFNPTLIGDGAFGARDVDFFSLELAVGDVVTMDAIRFAGAGNLYARLFDSAGNQLAADAFSGPGSSPRIASFIVPATGAYYIGVSGWANTGYDPSIAGSGVDGGQGTYVLSLERFSGGSTRLDGIATTATSGTPSNAGVASANTGQTITLTGNALLPSDQVVFSAADSNGRFYFQTVSPMSVAGDGSSLDVVVPIAATSGTVRLVRENRGIFLQVVPTLVDVDQGAGDSFQNGGVFLTGSGFADGAMAINFGGSTFEDPNQGSSEFDVYSNNTVAGARVPVGVPTGPISVTTLGGTSVPFGLAFTGIVASSDTGTAADGAEASANPGQSIILQGSNFDLSTDVVFLNSNASGVRYEFVVRPTAVNGDGTELTVQVPLEAVTGPVRVVGDQNATEALLQIVPTISFADLTSLSISTASFRLSGSGFIENSDTLYTFGSESLLDTSGVVNVYNSNRTSDLSLPYSSGIFGAVTVTTAGGTSAAFSVGLTEVDSVALSGTPANANEASANSGQAIDIVGSGLSTSTDVVGRYVDDSGNVQVTHLNPSSATADGTQATIQLPTWFNGAFGLQVVGAVAQPLLQIVPTIQSIDVYTTNGVRVDGRGFVENGSSYDYGGAVKTDTDGSVNVYSNGGRSDMGGLPVFGAGQLVVTTAGGTSAAVAYNFINPGLSTLYAVEQSSSGDLFVIAGSRVQRINSAGELQQTYASISLSYGGLYELTSPLELRDTPSSTLVTLPAGTLLVFKNNDVIDALDPSTDTVLASFDPGPNFGTIGGVFNPVTGTLFFLDWSPDEVIEIDPATGGELSRFAAPLAGGNGGITVDPVSGNLWLAFDGSSQLAEVQVDGTLLQTIDMASQGIATEMSGLDYLGGGQFLASSLRGVIYQLTTVPPPPGDPNGLTTDSSTGKGKSDPSRLGYQRLSVDLIPRFELDQRNGRRTEFLSESERLVRERLETTGNPELVLVLVQRELESQSWERVVDRILEEDLDAPLEQSLLGSSSIRRLNDG